MSIASSSSTSAAANAANAAGAPDHRFIGGNKHDAKYDRQIRLWGKEGQQALAESHVVVLGMSATVVEALKSVVLTGVHAFTIIDDAVVTDEDIATNFFVQPGDKGKSLARVTAQQLAELNSDCVALAHEVSPSVWVNQLCALTTPQNGSATRHQLMALVNQATIIANGPTQTPQGGPVVGVPTLILASHRYANHSRDSPLVEAAKRAPGSPPVVCVQSRGLLGFYQAFAHHDLVITRPHPSPQLLVADLRIFNPFPALMAWFTSHDPSDPTLFQDDIVTHSHIPFPAIIHQAYRQCCAAASTAPDSSSPDSTLVPPLKAPQYKALQSFIWKMARRQSPPQEAFMEAAEKCNTALNRPYQHYPSRSLVELWLHKCAFDANAPLLPHHDPHRTAAEAHTLIEQTVAWYITRAIREFAVTNSPDTTRYCVLPQSGYLPDMTATTEFFQELRAIYQQKHQEDSQSVAECAWAHLNGSSANQTALASYPDAGRDIHVLVEKEADIMVQNVWHLAVAQFASMSEGEQIQPSGSERQLLGRCLAHHNSSDEKDPFVLAMVSAVDLDSHNPSTTATTAHVVSAEVSEQEIESTAKALLDNAVALVVHAYPGGPADKVAYPFKDDDIASMQKACEEVARVGPVEVPSVTATLGALAAQESIKLIQRRRIPAHFPIVYSGYSNKLYVLDV